MLHEYTHCNNVTGRALLFLAYALLMACSVRDWPDGCMSGHLQQAPHWYQHKLAGRQNPAAQSSPTFPVGQLYLQHAPYGH